MRRKVADSFWFQVTLLIGVVTVQTNHYIEDNGATADLDAAVKMIKAGQQFLIGSANNNAIVFSLLLRYTGRHFKVKLHCRHLPIQVEPPFGKQKPLDLYLLAQR